ncbi:TolC family protein [Nannocystis pusilla]|uniref:TolC family protein n=1 Tax=Nannocystis pusilla TaxID=889268 RepID=UPI003B7CA3F9
MVFQTSLLTLRGLHVKVSPTPKALRPCRNSRAEQGPWQPRTPRVRVRGLDSARRTRPHSDSHATPHSSHPDLDDVHAGRGRDRSVVRPAAGAAPAPARTKPADPPAPLLAPAPEPAQTIPEPVVAGAQVLPLDTILKHAEENAMPVRTARSRLELGDAAVTGAKPLLPDNPQLYLGMGARLNPTAGPAQFELQGTLQQPIEIGRERSLRIKAGREYREFLDRELAQVRWTTHAQVHYAYNTALIAKERAHRFTHAAVRRAPPRHRQPPPAGR